MHRRKQRLSANAARHYIFKTNVCTTMPPQHRREYRPQSAGRAVFVVAEHVRPDNAFQFRIKMRKEVRVAQQYPVKEKDIIDFQTIQHDKKLHKIIPKWKLFLTPSHTTRTAAPTNSRIATASISQPMRCAPRKRSFLSGIAARFSFGAEPKSACPE